MSWLMIDRMIEWMINCSTALEDEELGLADMRTEMGEDGEWRAPEGVSQRSPEEMQAAVEARRKALEAKGGPLISAGAGGAGGVQRRARASHILVADEAQCLEIKTQLDAAAAEAAEGDSGVSSSTVVASKFSSLATEHSSCPSSGQGGLLGTFPPGKMVAAFDAVIFGAEGKEGEGGGGSGGAVGVVHGPVETQFGYHLVLIHERQ